MGLRCVEQDQKQQEYLGTLLRLEAITSQYASEQNSWRALPAADVTLCGPPYFYLLACLKR